MSVQLMQRAACSAGWLTAVLRGSAGVERAIDVLDAVGGSPQFLSPDAPDPLTLPFAVALWRRMGITGWSYVPLAPGDAAGLPGPLSFSTAAIDQGVALVSVGESYVGLVPKGVDPPMLWCEHETAGPLHGWMDSPADAERTLLEVLNRSVAAMEANDLASWREDTPTVRDSWDAVIPMPPGADARSERLALRSRRILELLETTALQDGGSRTAADAALLHSTFRELSRAARHAHAAAWNTGLRPVADRG